MPITTDLEQEILNHFMDEVEQAKRGEIDVFDVATRLNETRKALSDLYDELKDEVIEERSKYSNKESVTRNGYEINVQSRKYYKYGHDEGYNRINDKLKERKKMMRQSLKQNIEIIDKQTGEVIEPADFTESTYPVLRYAGGHCGRN